MNNDKYRLILEGIKKKIETGQLKVERTSAKGLGEEYEVNISSYRVSISLSFPKSPYGLKIMNEYGDIIDTQYIDNNSSTLYKPVKEAFEMMRRKAMNADVAIDTLLTTLENL